MEKEENLNQENIESEISNENNETDNKSDDNKEENKVVEEEKELTPEERIKELEDKLARTFAEMENQRRRFEKEKDDAYEYGGFAFAKEALNLIDNLARSKLILESDDALKDTEALKKTLEHFDIINKDLISIFTKNNIKPIDCLNKKLDPNLHQAMMEIEDDKKEPGTIVQEVQKGFMIKDRLLRPSLVGVSKKTEKKELTPEERIKELEDKLARTFAEMENQRRRFEKEKDDAYEYGGFAFAKEALNLIDNLARSKLILESDDALKDTEALKKTLEHFDIINKDLISIFTKNNIKPIDCLNKKLDPNLHQAMMEIEDDQKEPGTIVQEVQKGFMIKDRLLRPSLVGVSKKTEKKEEKSEENKENLNK